MSKKITYDHKLYYVCEKCKIHFIKHNLDLKYCRKHQDYEKKVKQGEKLIRYIAKAG